MAKNPGTFKSPSGKTVTIRGDWAEDFGITDWASLQKAIKQGIGGASGINATIDGTEYNLAKPSPGFRSEGQLQLGGGLIAAPTAGFLADHQKVIGPGSDNFNLGLGAVGAGFGLNALMGGLGGAAGGGAATGASGAGAAPFAGEAGLLDSAMQGFTAADAAAGANALGVGTTPGVSPATMGGFTGEQLAAAGVNPATVGLGGSGVGSVLGGGAGAAATGAGALSGLSGLLGGNNGSTLGIPNNVLGGLVQGVGGYLAADAQGDAYKDVATQYLNIGAPYRNMLTASYQPGFDLWSQPGYAGAFDRAADVATRQWSTGGNPANNPGIQGGILNQVMQGTYLPALSNYRGQLGQFGGLGLNTSGAASLGGAQSTGSEWEAIGAGLNTAFNPQPDWSQILRQFGTGSGNNLIVGGLPYQTKR